MILFNGIYSNNIVPFVFLSVIIYLISYSTILSSHFILCIDDIQPEHHHPDNPNHRQHHHRLQQFHDHHNIYSRYLNLLDDDEVTRSPETIIEEDDDIIDKKHDEIKQAKNEFEEGGLIHFQISDPENLRYTFKAKTSRIGVPFNRTFENIALVLAEPRAACTSIINWLEIKDNIALVERGFCPFLEKCIAIERSGGIGVLVYDNDKNNSEDHIEMIDDSTPRNCSIPAVYVLGKDGHMIVQSLLALRLSSALITIPIKSSHSKFSAGPPWSVL